MKVSDIKFHGNSSSGSHADICRRKEGRTAGHDEANGRTFTITRARLKHHKLPTHSFYLRVCASPESEMLEHLATLTLRLLMSYIYGAPILDVSRSHTTTHHSR